MALRQPCERFSKAAPSVFAPLIALGLLAALTGPTSGQAADAAHPAVVELFQSQGCSSCPPANANLLALMGRPDVLALTFEVTYWDQLGWKDTFGSSAFTARQWDYAHALRHREVFTPQVVVNGRGDGVGAAKGEIEALIAGNDRGSAGPDIVVGAGEATVRGPAGGLPAEVWLVRYDPALVQVPIARGENGGRTLPHRNVVRALVSLGVFRGGESRFALPPSAPHLAQAILVQSGRGGPVLAAARG